MKTKTKKKSSEPAEVFGQRVCRKCGSEDVKTLMSLPDQQFAGMTTDGRRYTSIQRERVSCPCGQISVVQTFKFIRTLWQD